MPYSEYLFGSSDKHYGKKTQAFGYLILPFRTYILLAFYAAVYMGGNITSLYTREVYNSNRYYMKINILRNHWAVTVVSVTKIALAVGCRNT